MRGAVGHEHESRLPLKSQSRLPTAKQAAACSLMHSENDWLILCGAGHFPVLDFWVTVQVLVQEASCQVENSKRRCLGLLSEFLACIRFKSPFCANIPSWV
jgi:hypothetical protein